MKIQHLYSYVGQCNETDCHMIRGVNGRNYNDGKYELTRHFNKHFLSMHPGKEVGGQLTPHKEVGGQLTPHKEVG